MDSAIIERVGKKLYQTERLKEMKRYLVFRFRCAMHKKYVDDLGVFFSENDFRKALLEGTPCFLEQTTRNFFYKDSTWAERIDIVKSHILELEKRFGIEFLDKLYVKREKVCLWQDSYEGKELTLNLGFFGGQRKEGCLALGLHYEGQFVEDDLYQIMFWVAKDKDSDKPTIYIGAIQGTPNGSEIIKGLTKAFFGYRTKNLIFYGLRSFAKFLGADRIYAVGNDGYYAMNHLRADRKLKTDFGAFWEECEGKRCEDKRFYVMPVVEYRKSMEELKPSKRAQHRKRFAKMDEIDEAVVKALENFHLNNCFDIN